MVPIAEVLMVAVLLSTEVVSTRTSLDACTALKQSLDYAIEHKMDLKYYWGTEVKAQSRIVILTCMPIEREPVPGS